MRVNLSHADAVARDEADETWPQIVYDAVGGQLEETYAPIADTGKSKSKDRMS
jgi:hypothetical protein